MCFESYTNINRNTNRKKHALNIKFTLRVAFNEYKNV